MPKPKRKKRESLSKYRSRLVRHYIHEGYPQKQAVAIAYSQTRSKRKTKRSKRRKSRRSSR